MDTDSKNPAVFGTDLTALAERGLLPRTFGVAALRS